MSYLEHLDLLRREHCPTCRAAGATAGDPAQRRAGRQAGAQAGDSAATALAGRR